MIDKKEWFFNLRHIPWKRKRHRQQFLTQELDQTFSVVIGVRNSFLKRTKDRREKILNLLSIDMSYFNIRLAIV